MSLPALHVDGNHIIEAGGGIFQGIGTTEFAMFKRYLDPAAKPDGWTVLVKPVLRERMKAARESGWTGPMIARVMRNAAPPNEFALDPWSYPMSAVTEFTAKLEAEGWYVDWTSGDNQICFPTAPLSQDAELNGSRGFNEHTNQFTAALVGHTNTIWNVCNEPFKNGPNTVSGTTPPPWAPVVQYTGDYEDNRDVAKDLNCVNLHTDRSDEGPVPKWVGKAHESAPYMWRFGKPVFYDEPMGFDEVAVPGRRSNVPYYAQILGSSLLMVSAVYFHSSAGIGSNGFPPITMECWKAFCRGAAVATI